MSQLDKDTAARAAEIAKKQIRLEGKGGATDGGVQETEPASSETAVPETAVSEQGPIDTSGPRIVINPSVFHDEKDALCVAFNEAFRLVMEDLGFRPEAEPTDAQRKFFADTAYRNDELQLRRTIEARICTFDTSVSGDTAPTAEQVEESVYFLDSLLDAGYCRNEWEESRVSEIRERLAASVGAHEPGGVGAPAEGDGLVDEGEQAAAKGGQSTWVQQWDGGRRIRDRSKTTIVTKGDSDWKKRKEAERAEMLKGSVDALKSAGDSVILSGGDATSSFTVTGEGMARLLQEDEEARTPRHNKIGAGLHASEGNRMEDDRTGKGSINQGLQASEGHRLEDAGKGGLVMKGSSEDKAQSESPAQPPAQPQAPTQPPAPASAADGGDGASERYGALEGATPNPNQPPENPNQPTEDPNKPPEESPAANEETPAEGPTSQDEPAAGPTDPHDEEERRRLLGGR